VQGYCNGVKNLFIGREHQWAREEPESDKNGTNEILFQLLSASGAGLFA
jgi:hypothetical protein